MTVQITELWQELCDVLSHHSQGSATCLDTLNRLFRKVPSLKGRSDLPVLNEQILQLTKEDWEMSRLKQLITKAHVTNAPPSTTTPPIVVIRWHSTDYLIDGRRRINDWVRSRKIGTHAVLLVEVT